MILGDAFKLLFSVLLPPRPGAALEEVYRWQLCWSGATFLAIGAVIAHILLACAFFPSIFAGFASVADVTELKNGQTEIHLEALNGEIRNAIRDQCKARDQKNGSAETFATREKYRLIDEFHKYGDPIHRQPTVPQCWELPSQ